MRILVKLLIILILSSCAGKGGDASLHVIVWKADGKQVMDGELKITYRTKKTESTKYHDIFTIVNGAGDLDNLKLGNYLVTFPEQNSIGGCATQFKISYESEVVIVLREGEFIVQPF